MPKKVDANQPEIVEAFRSAGLYVAVTSDLGAGFPDLVVGHPDQERVYLIEVKNPEYGTKLTRAERKFHELWGGLVTVITSAAEGFERMGVQFDKVRDK